MSRKDSLRQTVSEASRSGETLRPTEYLKVILSRRHLERCHDLTPDVEGVLDVDTGERFVVSRCQLSRSVAERCA